MKKRHAGCGHARFAPFAGREGVPHRAMRGRSLSNFQSGFSKRVATNLRAAKALRAACGATSCPPGVLAASGASVRSLRVRRRAQHGTPPRAALPARWFKSKMLGVARKPRVPQGFDGLQPLAASGATCAEVVAGAPTSCLAMVGNVARLGEAGIACRSTGARRQCAGHDERGARMRVGRRAGGSTAKQLRQRKNRAPDRHDSLHVVRTGTPIGAVPHLLWDRFCEGTNSRST